MTIRTATPDDAEALLSIYRPYVENTAISFEYDVPTIEEFRQRIEKTLAHYPYLVAVDSTTDTTGSDNQTGRIVGYAYAGQFQERAAYHFSAEASIYIDQDWRGQGIGRALYSELEKKLQAQGIHNLYACVTWIDQPNHYLTHQSPEFHEHMGFRRCAHFHKCGFKFGLWFDVIWLEKMLSL